MANDNRANGGRSSPHREVSSGPASGAGVIDNHQPPERPG
jgi:hypothetical protein